MIFLVCRFRNWRDYTTLCIWRGSLAVHDTIPFCTFLGEVEVVVEAVVHVQSALYTLLVVVKIMVEIIVGD